jgi:hypothetical protein
VCTCLCEGCEVLQMTSVHGRVHPAAVVRRFWAVDDCSGGKAAGTWSDHKGSCGAMCRFHAADVLPSALLRHAELCAGNLCSAVLC